MFIQTGNCNGFSDINDPVRSSAPSSYGTGKLGFAWVYKEAIVAMTLRLLRELNCMHACYASLVDRLV